MYIKYRVVNCESLRIRKSPSKTAKTVGYCNKGDIVNIVKDKSKKAEGITWLKCTKGWLSSNYLQRITPNYRKNVTKWEDIVYNKIIEIHCKHKGGAYSYEDIKRKKITTCSSAVSAVLQEAGVLKKGKLVGHTPKKVAKVTISQSISGAKNLISGTYRIVRVNRLFKDIQPKYNKKGIVYVYDSNIAINAGEGYIYSCNDGPTQLENGKYIKNKMRGGYCFTSKILYAIIPNN